MTKTARLLFAFWIILAGSIGSPQICRAEANVTLRPDREVRCTTVKISDIFDGVPKDIDREIAQAPAPGRQVTYDVSVLTRIADKYRLDWEPQSHADHITITTASTRVTAEVIRQAVIKKIKESDSLPLEKAGSIDVSFDNHALQVDLPADHGADFTLNNFTFDPLNRHFRTDLVAETSSGPFSLPVSGRILLKRSVPVLARRLEGGTIIGESDIDMMTVPEERVNPGIVTDKSQLIGRELRRDTDEGELLQAHDVIAPRLVKRGTLVTMKIETPLMVVTAQGKALEDGTAGDVVRVVNTQSNRTIEGTVSDNGTVIIHTAQVLAQK